MALNKETAYKYILQNQKDLNIDIIEIDYERCTFKCLVCSSVRTNSLRTIYENGKMQNYLHSECCSRYYRNIIRQELGKEADTKFRAMYANAQKRCTDPDHISYKQYKGKFKFDDFPDYFNHCYPAFKYGFEKYGLDTLSIDRIENSKGYEPGNVRFVPMSINALNKEAIRPIAAYNIKTKHLIETNNLVELARMYLNTSGPRLRYYVNLGSLYLDTWHIFYTDESKGLLEHYKEQQAIYKLSGTTNVKKIKHFSGEHYFLCNSFRSPITLEGITYTNNEAAFQAYKTTNTEVRKIFSILGAPKAKVQGSEIPLRSDWEDVKIKIMYAIVLAKFTQNEDLKKALLATGDAYIEYAYPRSNKTWGTVNGVGNNYLGKILMSVRDKLRNNS